MTDPPRPPEDPDDHPDEPVSPPPAPAPEQAPSPETVRPPDWAGDAPPTTGDPVGPPEKSAPGIGAGVGIGCGAHVLGFVIWLVLISVIASGEASILASTFLSPLAPFIVLAVVSLALLIPARTRRMGAGMTIVAAASWLIVIGPCLGAFG